MQARKRPSPTQKYGKLPTFDDQKPIRTENNFRSNPNHKQHERRPSRPDTRPMIGGDRKPFNNERRSSRPDARPSTGGYKGSKPDGRSTE